MSSETAAISARGLGKSYRVPGGKPPARPGLLGRLGLREAREKPEPFWALRDASFDLEPGDVLGLVGRNGAGKSTLLKVLARITEPSAGEVDIRGRVASLLEVGTGFHSELTGRENVYLSGTILGMKRREVARRFDAIVDFSGVERFLDMPVKRYSSGMYMRLAFAVAAHVEPDILIVDEALAVGDAEFQEKCLGKIGEVSREEGRSVIIVSHTMASIEALCNRALYLEKGRVVLEGPAREVVSHYLATSRARADEGTPLADRTDRTGTGAIRLTSFRAEGDDGRATSRIASGRDATFVFGFDSAEGLGPLDDVDIGISFHAGPEVTLFVLYSSYTGRTLRVEPGRSGEFRCTIPRFPLTPGRYEIGVRVVADRDEADWPRERAGAIDVEVGDFYRSGKPGCEGATRLLVDGTWEVRS